MAKRKKSDAPQHETFPGPGPGRMDNGASGIHPVEQMVDAAIDRIAREYNASRDAKLHSDTDATPHARPDLTPHQARPDLTPHQARPDLTPYRPDLTPHQARPDLTPHQAIVPRTVPQGPMTHALARPVDIKRPGRLRWKGLDVSDDFRRYAERIARGEDLPPFEGRILAEPNPKFPWEPEAVRNASRRASRQHVVLWSSAAIVGGLLAWTVAMKLTTPPPQSFETQPNPATAILANRTPEAPVAQAAHPEPVTPPEDERGGKVADESPAAPPATPANVVVKAPPSASAYRPVATAPAPVFRREAPAVALQPESGRSVPVDIAAPGALKEALGAMLSARAGSDPSVSGSPAAAKTENASAAASTAASGGALDTTKGASAGKEPSGESSAKGSLLVETPSF